MRRYIVIPDSFKGTLSSKAICGIVRERILAHDPDAEVLEVPVADGGEGSVECLLTACGGEKVFAKVSGPYGETMDSFYGLLPDGTAVIEMAACAGLPLVGDNRSAADTTTYGVGQLVAHALEAGAKKIILCLGGSATNDGGCGMAAALGARFYGKNGTFVPVGRTLSEIEKIDLGEMNEKLKKAQIITMCDINNPLYGPEGAAYVFAPQKGVKEGELEMLDAGLRHLDEVVQKDLGLAAALLPGTGAAGGMGFASVVFLKATLQMGIETVLDTVRFDELAKTADFVLTGEGKIDSQSLRGKVVIGVARRAKKAGVPVIALVGDIGDHVEGAYEEGVTGIFSINRVAVPFSEAKLRSADDLALTADNIMRFITSLEKRK